MIEVKVQDNTEESFDKAYKLFKKLVNNEGHLKEIQERRYYTKTSDKKRKEQRERERGKK
jgi:ribosomal protein S21